MELSQDRVGKYERLELLIRVDAQYQNPFDPDEVDLTVQVTAPSGRRLSVPAFYCQDYERRRVARGGRQEDWLYPLGMPVWKARFAPMEVGAHLAVANLKNRDGTTEFDAVRFECTPSGSKGFLRISRKDPRFFEFSEGQPFFAVGQNLAFVGQQQYVDLSKAEGIFAALSENGANFLRIWTCCEDWALAVEARKSAWGRSWSWRPPIVPVPEGEGHDPGRKCLTLTSDGRATLDVSPSHPVALRPGTRYVVSGKLRTDGQVSVLLQLSGVERPEVATGESTGRWVEFQREFRSGSNRLWLGRMAFRLDGSGTAWLDDLSLREAEGGPELLWEADVNRSIRGFYNPVDCFMLDQIVEAAEKSGIYLQLCLITRDLYMSSLKDDTGAEYQQAIEDAHKLLRYAVARWGYSTSVAAWEYFNEIDPGLPTDRFYTELGDYLERIDVYGHLRTTSTWHPSARDCRHPKLDVAEVHYYLRPSESKLKDEVEAALDRAAFLREHAPNKPALIGEFGLATEKWGLSGDMKTDAELTHFHNSLWASALSGASGTALFWWWDQLDRMDAYHHYRPLAAFLEDVPFTTAGLQGASATVSHPKVRSVGLRGRDRAYLWLFNSDAAWAGKGVRGVKPTEIRGATLEIGGLESGKYRVQWWDTYNATVIQERDASFAAGSIKLSVPTFARDIACKVLRRKTS